MAIPVPQPRERVLQFGQAAVRVLDWGGPPPILVGWPGMGGTAEYFGMLRDVVPHRVVGVDPPGVGPVSNGVPDRETLATVWTGVLRWAAREAHRLWWRVIRGARTWLVWRSATGTWRLQGPSSWTGATCPG
jgi:hypothetical protein